MTWHGFLKILGKLNTMADNPNKKGRDAKTVSQQPHEQAYQKRKAAGKTGSAAKNRVAKAQPNLHPEVNNYTSYQPIYNL